MEEILKQIELIEGMNLNTRTECFMQLQQVKKLKEMLKTELNKCNKPHVSNQRELLIAFLMKIENCFDMGKREDAEKCVDAYLKGNL